MKISVTNARSLAQSLTLGADQAEKDGLTEFDLIDSLQAADDAARADLVAAIAEASAKPAG